MLLLKAKCKLILLEAFVVRFASSSILRPVLLTTALCSVGSDGVSVGKADAKFHSSSSAGCGAAGLEGKPDAERAANGSDACAAGGLNADCW